MHTRDQFCLILSDPMDCSQPGPSVHGILQARILEWVAIFSSKKSSRWRDRTCISYVSCIGRWILYHWSTREDLLNRWFQAIHVTYTIITPQVHISLLKSGYLTAVQFTLSPLKVYFRELLLMNMLYNLFKYSTSYGNLDSFQFSFPLLYTIILLCLTSLVIRWKWSTFVASYHISLATSTAIVDRSLWALSDSSSVLSQAGHFHSLSCFKFFSFNSKSS